MLLKHDANARSPTELTHHGPFFPADSFETMLKSLLGYQAGMGGGSNESVVRKKLYEGAINNTLKNSFPQMLKVCLKQQRKAHVHVAR